MGVEFFLPEEGEVQKAAAGTVVRPATAESQLAAALMGGSWEQPGYC